VEANVLPDLNAAYLQPEPLETARTIPASWYTHAGFHTWDRDHVFAKYWQLVGPVSKVQSPGDFVVGEIAGSPILILRDKDNTLQGFYNVCRHRGGPLATEDGNTSVLRCHYHGWTYSLSGNLIGTPEFEGVQCFNPEEFSLPSILVGEWEGLVFACLNPNPVPLERMLSGISERIAPISLKGLQFYETHYYDVACNWKLYVDNYMEGYHLPMVHPGLSKLLDYKEYTTETFEYHSVQQSPLRSDTNFYNSDGGNAYYYFVFPNMMLNIMPNRLQTNLVVPLSENRCRVIFDYYYGNVTQEEGKALIKEDLVFSEEIQQEDIDICERVQKGLASGSYHQGRFSVKRELGVHHFQSLLKTAYRDGLTAPHSKSEPQACTLPC
jgi:choline monooxygenase